MRLAFVVAGQIPKKDVIDAFYAVCHSVDRANELVEKANAEDPEHIYTWYAVAEEEGDL